MIFLLKLYRGLTYTFHLLLIIGLGLSIYEYFIKKVDYDWTNIPVNGLIIYLLITSFYFIRKTSKLYNLNPNGKPENLKDLVNFKFAKFVGISNLIFGIVLLLSALYFLFFNQVGEISTRQILRISILVVLGLYGFLKIIYARRILKII